MSRDPGSSPHAAKRRSSVEIKIARPLTTLLFFLSCTVSAQVGTTYGKLPLSFEPNQGQTDPRVRFISRGPGYTIFLSSRSATFALLHDSTPDVSAVVRMDLLGGSSTTTMEPQEQLPGIANYLLGSTRSKWPTSLPTYAKTRSRNVYPGIDLVFYGTQGRLEYDFILAPKANPSSIRLKFRGAAPSVDASGD